MIGIRISGVRLRRVWPPPLPAIVGFLLYNPICTPRKNQNPAGKALQGPKQQKPDVRRPALYVIPAHKTPQFSVMLDILYPLQPSSNNFINGIVVLLDFRRQLTARLVGPEAQVLQYPPYPQGFFRGLIHGQFCKTRRNIFQALMLGGVFELTVG